MLVPNLRPLDSHLEIRATLCTHGSFGEWIIRRREKSFGTRSALFLQKAPWGFRQMAQVAPPATAGILERSRAVNQPAIRLPEQAKPGPGGVPRPLH